MLIHEATGTTFHHSTAFQAGEIAARANAKTLYLIHYPPEEEISREFALGEAKRSFPGDVFMAEDLMEIELRRE